MRNGFLVFNEVNLSDSEGAETGKKMDMLAIDLQNDIEIYVEAKGDIFSQTSGESCLQLATDFDRMQKYRVAVYQHQLATEDSEPEMQHKFSLIMTTSHQGSMRNWWVGCGDDKPQLHRSSSWSDFHGKVLCSEKLISRWSIPLKTGNLSQISDNADGFFDAHGLYALFSR